MAQFPGAKDKFVDRDRVWINQNDQATIVIHGTGGNPNQTADQLGDYFETTPLMTSVHYGIDRAGNIDQYVLEQDGCAGEGILDPGHDPFWDQYAPNPNWHSLGVETENDQTNSLPLTDPQKQTLFRLVKHWVDKYGIPLSHIKGHFSLEPVERHNCPGPNFPWQELFAYLNGGTMQIPTGWTDDGTTLKGPNGIPVVLGFRDHVLNSNWDPANWPLEPEKHLTGLEMSNPTLGDGQSQIFRWKRLEYTPKMGVFEGWLGQELLWYQQEVKQLETEIATLTQPAQLLEQLNGLIAQASTANAQIGSVLTQAAKLTTLQ